MKKILLSVLTIGVVATVAVVASQAFFSDTEKSVVNTFTAGAIDLQIDYDGYYNKAVDNEPQIHWDLKDLVGEKFFNFEDLKPGDYGEGTISMHVINNDAWACMAFTNLHNDDNGITTPESLVDSTEGADNGELAQRLFFTAWADDGDNIWEEGEPLLFSNEQGPASDVLGGRVYSLADSTTGNGPILANDTKYIGLSWCFGAMQVDVATHTIACDGSGEGNETQTDSLTADVEFSVVQSRNNPTYVCGQNEDNNERVLILENKTQNYNRILNDGRYGVLHYNAGGPMFDWTLDAYGLPEGNYNLIYYADPWAGNHPGYNFGQYATNGSGYIHATGSNDTGDLPNASDANSGNGAKIWLIPSSAYDAGNLSVTVWPFDNSWLFESNLITYDKP
jgi:hypothetical protein